MMLLIVALLWISGFYPNDFISPMDTYENLKERNSVDSTLFSVLGANSIADSALKNLTHYFLKCDNVFLQLDVPFSSAITCPKSMIASDSNSNIIQSDDRFYWFENIDMFAYSLRHSLSQNLYSKVLLVMPLEFYYSTNFKSLQCGTFYPCNFEVDYILLETDCLLNSECVKEQINTYSSNNNNCNGSSNITELKNQFIYNNLDLFVVIYGDSNNQELIFTQLKANLMNCVSLKYFNILMINNDNKKLLCQNKFNQIGINQYFKFKSTSSIKLIPEINATNYTGSNNLCDKKIAKLPTEKLFVSNYDLNNQEAFSSNTLIVLAVQSEPFIFKNSNDEWDGYCVDILKEISALIGVNFMIKETLQEDKIYQLVNDTTNNITSIYKWSGAMGDLLDNQADLIAGKFLLNSLKNNFIEYSFPYYVEDGIVMLTLSSNSQNQLFLFANVFTWQLWLCLFSFVLLTSVAMFLFDKTRPLNEDELKMKTKPYQYNLIDSLWFSVGAFTLAGGVHPPKALSIKILFASFWFFSAITVSTYQANLAAFLTVSTLGTQINSIKDLTSQTAIEYTTIENSDAYKLLERLKDLENKFLTLWKDVSLGENSLGYNLINLKSYAIWDYPLKDVFTILWKGMNTTGFLKTISEGLTRISSSSSSNKNFGILIDYSYANYLVSKDCSLSIVGSKIALRSYGFGFRKDFGYRESLNNAILQLKRSEVLDSLSAKWWKSCEEDPREFTPITLSQIGGVFVFLLAGVLISIPFQALVLIIKAKQRKPKSSSQSSSSPLSSSALSLTPPTIEKI